MRPPRSVDRRSTDLLLFRSGPSDPDDRSSGAIPKPGVFVSRENQAGFGVLSPRELEVLVGETALAISHATYNASVGVMNLDVVTDSGRVYRFATEEIDGEHTAGGWTQDHYSLTLEHFDAATTHDERTDLVGTVVKADLIQSDEWLGPVDHSIESYGENPRMLFDGKVGSCPPGVKFTTVICGVVLQGEDWKLLVRTHSFPQHLVFTTEPAVITDFLNQYSVGSSTV